MAQPPQRKTSGIRTMSESSKRQAAQKSRKSKVTGSGNKVKRTTVRASSVTRKPKGVKRPTKRMVY